MDNTENSFSIFGPYAKQFAGIQARSPAQSTRSQIRKLQTTASAKPPSTAGKNLFGFPGTSTTSTKTGTNLESYYKKPSTRFVLPSQARVETRMDKAEERRKKRRAEVAIENREINMTTLFAKTPGPKATSNNKTHDDGILVDFSNIRLGSPPPRDLAPIKESRREQLLRWKQEKEQLSKLAGRKPPPFKAGAAMMQAQSQTIALSKFPRPTTAPSRTVGNENIMMERRVTRAMAKAKGTPFTESVVNKKSRPNFGSQNDITVSKAKLLNGPDSFRSKHLPVKAKMVGMNGSTGPINRVAVNFASSAPLSLIPNSEQIPQSSQVPNIDKVTPTPAAPPVVKKKPKGMQFDSIYVEYTDAFIKACNSLINYSRKWSDLLTISRDVIPEEICGDIESSVGQAKLLLESKLPQFAELLYHYLSKHEGPQPVMPEDLQGWWAVAIISIDNVKNRFEKLAVLEKNQWVEEQQFLENNRIVKLQSPGVRRRSSVHKNAKPSSGLLAFLAEKRRKAFEEKAAKATSVTPDRKENISITLVQ